MGGGGAPAGHTNSTLIDSTSSPLCVARAYCSGGPPRIKMHRFLSAISLPVDLIT